MELIQYRWVQGWHINAAGSLFGGKLLSWVDEDTMMLAHNVCTDKAYFVTGGMEKVVFHQPVEQGIRLKFNHRIVNVGNTSLWTFTQVFNHDKDEKVFSCFTRLVSVDSTGRPQSVEEVSTTNIKRLVKKDDYWQFVELIKTCRL